MATSTGHGMTSRFCRLSKILPAKRNVAKFSRTNNGLVNREMFISRETSRYLPSYNCANVNIFGSNRFVIGNRTPVCNFSTSSICYKQRRTSEDKVMS